MLKDIFVMIADIRRANPIVDMWGAALNVPQIIGGLIFIQHVEAQVVFVCVLVTLLIASQIHKRRRFSRSMALCHVPWVLLIPWLTWRLLTNEYSTFFTIWTGYAVATMAISVLFDTRDLVMYWFGNTTYRWS